MTSSQNRSAGPTLGAYWPRSYEQQFRRRGPDALDLDLDLDLDQKMTRSKSMSKSKSKSDAVALESDLGNVVAISTSVGEG